jgi:hypothetical protein
MPIGLKIETTNTDRPDTRLTRKNIDKLIDDLEDKEDRKNIEEIFQTVKASQFNPYQLHEMEELSKIVYNPKYKLREIVSTFQGILMRLKPSVGNSGGKRIIKKTRKIHSRRGRTKRNTRF